VVRDTPVARLVTRRSQLHGSPPPPSTGVFRAFVRMHRLLTSTFGRRLLCLWGQFVGTYSALAYAAYARWRGRERPVRCGFATEVPTGWSVAWACPVHARAVALLKVPQGLGAAISTSGEITAGRLRGTVATPMAVRAWLPVSVPYRSMMSLENGFITAVVGVAGFGVDVAVAHQPGTDAVEVTDGGFQAGEHGEGGETRGALCLLEGYLGRNFAEGARW
jgi:hypothetical protein